MILRTFRDRCMEGVTIEPLVPIYLAARYHASRRSVTFYGLPALDGLRMSTRYISMPKAYNYNSETKVSLYNVIRYALSQA